MLVVDTYLGESTGKGVGLFASQLILKGTFYWVRNTAFDRTFSELDIDQLDPLSFLFIQTYGFLEPSGLWYLCIDNARFCNHSENANTQNIFNPEGQLLHCIASQDIQAGSEILCDYRKTCVTCQNDLGFKDIESL